MKKGKQSDSEYDSEANDDVDLDLPGQGQRADSNSCFLVVKTHGAKKVSPI